MVQHDTIEKTRFIVQFMVRYILILENKLETTRLKS